MNKIFKLKTIKKLSVYLDNIEQNKLRKDLLKEYDKLCDGYKNIVEWNRLVRICEALNIIGWGKRKPVEAYAEKWINGSFYTHIQDKYFNLISCKGWGKKGKTFVLDDKKDTTNYGIEKLESQRNLLPKSPIRWSPSGNHQKSVKPLYKEFDKLKDLVVKNLRPELYGNTFSYLIISLNFSHHDDKYETVRWEYFHSKNDVPKRYKKGYRKDKYGIIPKFEFGRLSKTKGEIPETSLHIDRYFTRAFGEKKLKEQKNIIANDFQDILDILSEKLKKNKIDYNVDLLKEDLKKVMEKW